MRTLYKIETGQNGISRTEGQIKKILEKLREININTPKEARGYYEYLKERYGLSKDVIDTMLKKLIDEKYESMDLQHFFINRNS